MKQRILALLLSLCTLPVQAATSVTWNGTTYSIPAAGERNWSSLSNFLIALGNNAAIRSEMFQAIRVATTTPVTVSNTTDFTIVTELASPAAVAVNLPAGEDGQMFLVLDGTGDAASNNITITPDGTETILGASTLVLNKNKQAVLIQYDEDNTDWRVLFNVRYPDNISLTSEVTGVLPIANGGTNSSTALNNNRVMVSSSGAIAEAAAITGSRALASDANGIPTASATTATELGYVSGVTSAIQTQITANANNLTTHEADTTTHGTTGNIVGTSDTQTLTNKTIDADNNTISNLAHGAEVDNPSSGVHGVVGSVVGTTDSQTLTNKTLTTPTINGATLSGTLSGDATLSGEINFSATSNINLPSGTTAQRPGSPTAGDIRYNTDSNAFEGYTTAWGALGGGSAGINYIDDNDAESGVGSWAAYADAAASTPADGTGGSPTASITSQSGTVLRGSNSFDLDKDASNRQGEGASYAFTIDAADNNKILKISFDFDASDSDYSAGDVGVYIYDVTNTTLITPSQADLAGGTGKFEATFVTTDSTSYRLILHIASTNAAAYAVYFDNVFVGPETAFVAAPSTDWESYTPSATAGFGTITSVNLEWRREADSLYIRGDFTTGTTTATEAQLGLPDGLTVGGIATSAVEVGKFERDASLTNAIIHALLATSGDTYLNFGRNFDGTSLNILTPINGNDASGSTARVSVWAGPIPIAEWSGSGVNLSAARVEYVFNTSGTTTAGATDSTSFGYGPNGAAIGSIASTTTASNTRLRVEFQQAIQANDVLILEVDEGSSGSRWVPVSTNNSIDAYKQQGGFTYGMGLENVSSTQVNVVFGNGGRLTTNTTYNTAGSAWSAVAAWRWRVRKASPNAPAGIQLATDSVPGLLEQKTKWQIKYLSGNVSVAGTLSDLTFSNLTVGKTYRVTLNAWMYTTGSSSEEGTIQITHNSSTIASYMQRNDTSPTGGGSAGISTIFVAAATSVTFVFVETGTVRIDGDGTRAKTHAIIEELGSYESVSEF